MISLNAETLRSRTATTRSRVTEARVEAIIAWWMSCRSPVTAWTASSFELDCSCWRFSIAPVSEVAKAPAEDEPGETGPVGASGPLSKLSGGDLTGWLMLQYFGGYGESLLDYKKKLDSQFRLGIAVAL